MLPEGRTLLHSIDQSVLDTRLSTLHGEVRLNEPLSCHTTIGVGGKAACFFSPKAFLDLASVIDLCQDIGYPYYLLGRGSNLLFSDRGYAGVVISTTQLRGIFLENDCVRVFAGESLSTLLDVVNRTRIQSLNFLAGIPGTVGGATAMNAGIPARAIGDIVEEVAVLDSKNDVRILKARDCEFSYRRSAILEQQLIVLWTRLHLGSELYDREEILAHKRASQPLFACSAGCVFKNPLGISAGQMIEEARLKGFNVGMAKVSEKHANFILNLGGATSAEIRKLIDIVRQKVYKSFRILLELEIEVIDG